MTQQTNIISF